MSSANTTTYRANPREASTKARVAKHRQNKAKHGQRRLEITLPETIIRELDRLCELEHVSRADLLVMLITGYRPAGCPVRIQRAFSKAYTAMINCQGPLYLPHITELMEPVAQEIYRKDEQA